VERRADITVFRDTVHDFDRLLERLQPFDIIVTNRERTPFPSWLIERLPKLELLATTGGAQPRNRLRFRAAARSFRLRDAPRPGQYRRFHLRNDFNAAAHHRLRES
jgi:hypothetical protein